MELTPSFPLPHYAVRNAHDIVISFILPAHLHHPVLYHIPDRIIVYTFIYPSLIQPPIVSLISEQFAFRPSVTTTATTISIIHHASTLLTTNPMSLSDISIDFWKAPDCVRHHILTQILASMTIPNEIYKWPPERPLRNATRYVGLNSSIVYVNASVVQRSIIGPLPMTSFSVGPPPHIPKKYNIKIRG